MTEFKISNKKKTFIFLEHPIKYFRHKKTFIQLIMIRKYDFLKNRFTFIKS